MMRVCNRAVDHATWCEYEDYIYGIHTLTGRIMFRCPQCWGSPLIRGDAVNSVAA